MAYPAATGYLPGVPNPLEPDVAKNRAQQDMTLSRLSPWLDSDLSKQLQAMYFGVTPEGMSPRMQQWYNQSFGKVYSAWLKKPKMLTENPIMSFTDFVKGNVNDLFLGDLAGGAVVEGNRRIQNPPTRWLLY